MDIGTMLLDIIRSGGGRNLGGQLGGKLGGLLGYINPILGKIGQLGGKSFGGRGQKLLEGEDTTEQLLGMFLVDPALMAPMQESGIPLDLLAGGPTTESSKAKKKKQGGITFG